MHPLFALMHGRGFLKRPVVEASCNSKTLKEKAEKRFLVASDKKTEWVPDEPGFITARVNCNDHQ